MSGKPDDGACQPLEALGSAGTEAERALCAELEEAAADLEQSDVACVIPEIGANLAYALPEARRLEEVAGIPGRLIAVRGRVARVGRAAMGGSRHMGRTLLMVREYFPEARCVINLRNNEVVRRALAGLPWRVADMPPVEGYRQTDEDWKRDLRATMAACQELPDVIAIPDRLNLERLVLVLGKSLQETVEKVKLLAHAVREQG
mgnify:CR=1 FL=1